MEATKRLYKFGPMLCVCLTEEDAKDKGASATAPGKYGNWSGRADGFIIEEETRSDGVPLYCVYAGSYEQ